MTVKEFKNERPKAPIQINCLQSNFLDMTVKSSKMKGRISEFNQHKAEGNISYLQIEARKLTRSMCAILHFDSNTTEKG
jgi:hypothetical protein